MLWLFFGESLICFGYALQCPRMLWKILGFDSGLLFLSSKGNTCCFGASPGCLLASLSNSNLIQSALRKTWCSLVLFGSLMSL